jgi:hypothetical protein
MAWDHHNKIHTLTILLRLKDNEDKVRSKFTIRAYTVWKYYSILSCAYFSKQQTKHLTYYLLHSET